MKSIKLSFLIFFISNTLFGQGTVTDVDGNIYNYSTIGNQQWTTENAENTSYRDGTPIPQVTDFTTWQNLTTGAWCYYNNDPTKGKLYNWYAVAGIHDNDPNTPNKEFAPNGWEVPSDQDWTTLEEYLIANGFNYDGTTTGNKIAKAMASSTLWNSSTNVGAIGNNQSLNNSSGFNAFPFGNRASGSFESEGDATVFWCSTEFDASFSWFRTLSVNSVLLFRNNNEPKQEGFSVRFIQADCQISASATEVCAGDSVTLTAVSNTGTADLCDLPASLQTDLVGYWPFCGDANDVSGNGNNGTVNGATLTTDRFGNTDNAYLFDGSTSIINLPEISTDIGTPGTITTYSMWFKGNAPIQGGGSNGIILSAKSPTTNDFYIRFEVTYVGDHFLKVYYKMPTESNEPFSLFENSSPTWHNIIVEINGVTGDYSYYFDGVNIPEMNFNFNPNNNYFTPSRNWQIGRMDPPPNGFQPHTFQGSIDDIAVWNRALTPTEISSIYNSNFTTYLWSTSDNTETISVNPTETTEYWVDVTTNGVTCREYVTINVTAPVAPTGDAEQTFCSGATVADLVATGTAVQWYDAATGGNLLDPTTTLTNGQIVYATQTVDGCESDDRLVVTALIQELTITASATEVCAGEQVDLTASSNVVDNGCFGNQTNELMVPSQFNSIQLAIDNANNGDTIILEPGTYVVNELIFNSKIVNLVAQGDNTNTFIDGNGTNRLLTINNPLDCAQLIKGISFVHGNALIRGGYVTAVVSGNTIFRDCKFENNGGGTGNTLFRGSGVDYTFFENCIFKNNSSENYAGAGTAFLRNCFLTQNTGWNNSSPAVGCKIFNTTIINNGGGAANPWTTGGATNSEVMNSIIYNNGGNQECYNCISVNYSNIEGGYAGTGNINANPQLDGLGNPIASSPGIDLGNPDLNGNGIDYTTDIEDQDPDGTRMDMGAYYFQQGPIVNNPSNGSSYLWSTGDTTESISVNPTATTDYWVDVTTNGVTCRETITITVTAPAAPTGDAEQTFCSGATVADLVATGTSIQWYDAATGGNLLDPTTTLTNGQIVYATQTVDGCESDDRLVVTALIQELTITASATEVCAGEQVDLSVAATINDLGSTGQLVNQATISATSINEQIFATTPGLNYRLEISGLATWFNGCGSLSYSPAYVLAGFEGNTTPAPREMSCDNTQAFYSSVFCDYIGLRPTPDVYNSNHAYDYYFTALSNNITVGFSDSNLGDNCGAFTFKLYADSTPANATTYLWSTGDTTANISVTPSETTEYWVDVTTNGVTCREYVTINVTAPAAPTGDAEQTLCDTATIADLSATGDNIQWYDAATGGNLLDSTTTLTDGQMVYASQTVNGCESNDRLEVTVFLQDISITASATQICSGEEVSISLEYQESTICDMDITLTDVELGDDIPGFTYGGFYNNHYYYVYDTPTSWTEGEEICRQNGGYLVCINSEEENTFVSNLTDNNIWIGMFRDPDTCEFRWLDCIDITYTNWRSNEPNSGPCGEPYVQIIRGCSFGYNTWNNLGNNSSNGPCYSNMVPIMEIDPSIYNGSVNSSTSFLWSTGDTSETITVTPTETTEYWVDVTTNGVTCREYVTIIVNDLPEAPTGENINYFINCDSFSPTLNGAIATLTGDNIKLYDAAVGGNLLDPNSNILDGQVVYASQTLDSCESSNRLEVQLNLYILDTPVTDAPNNIVSFCNEQNLTILDLAPAQTATDRLWYETATSTIPIPETTTLVDGVTYYVSNHDIETGCESDRLAMTVEINNPEAPTGDSVQSFCDNVTVSDLSATGSNIQWYDAASGGNVLDSSSALSDGQLLYASQTENGCESITRLEVSVEIDIIPDPILITTELEFCLAREATLADLEVEEQGFALEWYDSFSGGNMLSMDTILEDGVSYYATLYDVASGCESLMRLEVVPTIIPCEVVIYNALSLNDNGMNDYMVIENAAYFPDNNLQVFNRDGHLIYTQSQYGIGDNFFRGIANVSGIFNLESKLPTGSYLYVFNYFNPYEQEWFTLKGFLTINSN